MSHAISIVAAEPIAQHQAVGIDSQGRAIVGRAGGPVVGVAGGYAAAGEVVMVALAAPPARCVAAAAIAAGDRVRPSSDGRCTPGAGPLLALSAAGPGGVFSALTALASAAGVVNAAAAADLHAYATRTGRVAHALLLSDSHGVYGGYGIVGGLSDAMAALPTYGTGIIGPGARIAAPRWRVNRQSNQPAGFGTNGIENGYCVNTACTWNGTTGALAKAGNFKYTSNAVAHPTVDVAPSDGDWVDVYDAAQAVWYGFFAVDAALSTPAALRLKADARLPATMGPGSNLAGLVVYYHNGAAGTAWPTVIPPAQARQWNVPWWWSENLGYVYFMGPAFTGFSNCSMLVRREVPMRALTYSGATPVTYRFQVFVSQVAGAVGTHHMHLYKWDGYVNFGGASSQTRPGAGAYDVTINTAGGVDGQFQELSSEYAPAPGDNVNHWILYIDGAVVGAGLALPLGLAISDASMAFGVSFTPLFHRASATSGHWCDLLSMLSDETWSNLFQMLVAHADGFPGATGVRRVCFWLYGTSNNAADTSISKDGVHGRNTGAGWAADVAWCRALVKSRWDAYYGAGASDEDLYFAVCPPHPISDAPDGAAPDYTDEFGEWLIREETAALGTLCTGTTFGIDLRAAMGPTAAADISNAGLTATGDASHHVHLNSAGYAVIGSAMVAAMVGA